MDLFMDSAYASILEVRSTLLERKPTSNWDGATKTPQDLKSLSNFLTFDFLQLL